MFCMASTDLPMYLQHKKASRSRGDDIRDEKAAIFTIEPKLIR
jgi:hypothetical protein